MSTGCDANTGTSFNFPSLEPAFSTFYNMIRDYNRGWARCNAGEDDPWFHRFPLITYLLDVTPKSQYTDDLHDEVLQNDMHWRQLEFRCHVTVDPKKQELDKFGLDEKVDLMAYPSLPVLEDLGLVTQGAKELFVGPRRVIPDISDYNNGPLMFACCPGDRLWWARELFEVQTVYPYQYYGNTNIPMYLVLVCNRFRPVSSELEEGKMS